MRRRLAYLALRPYGAGALPIQPKGHIRSNLLKRRASTAWFRNMPAQGCALVEMVVNLYPILLLLHAGGRDYAV
jgi:hypothetical protein